MKMENLGLSLQEINLKWWFNFVWNGQVLIKLFLGHHRIEKKTLSNKLQFFRGEAFYTTTKITSIYITDYCNAQSDLTLSIHFKTFCWPFCLYHSVHFSCITAFNVLHFVVYKTNTSFPPSNRGSIWLRHFTISWTSKKKKNVTWWVIISHFTTLNETSVLTSNNVTFLTLFIFAFSLQINWTTNGFILLFYCNSNEFRSEWNNGVLFSTNIRVAFSNNIQSIYWFRELLLV